MINSADRQGDRQINARVKITSCLAEILMETWEEFSDIISQFDAGDSDWNDNVANILN